ncbi:hypothetical protein G7Y89_g9755 [Cudoniella acicularis]|uniref:BTB domain-containing protein n=1 Tax=Cudoniella acicularis TaxID=354080 RepID=A0A8H4VZC2_9HELO|nr:hypothetical protein G7Y89_g9755 [Cudoniella acicularis]
MLPPETFADSLGFEFVTIAAEEGPFHIEVSDLDLDMVQIVAGEGDNQIGFSAIKTLLCSACPWFDTTLFLQEWSGIQPGPNIIEFPDVTPRTINAFITWLGGIPLEHLGKWTLESMVDLYLFGEKICCHNLKNKVMDMIQGYLVDTSWQNKRSEELNSELILRIFKKTSSTKTAPLRKFCAAVIIWNGRDDKYGPNQDVRETFKKCEEFKQEYDVVWNEGASRVLLGHGYRDPYKACTGGVCNFSRCAFHFHEKSEEENIKEDGVWEDGEWKAAVLCEELPFRV